MLFVVTYEAEGVEVTERTFEKGLEAQEDKDRWEKICPKYVANIFPIPDNAYVRFH